MILLDKLYGYFENRLTNYRTHLFDVDQTVVQHGKTFEVKFF